MLLLFASRSEDLYTPQELLSGLPTASRLITAEKRHRAIPYAAAFNSLFNNTATKRLPPAKAGAYQSPTNETRYLPDMRVKPTPSRNEDQPRCSRMASNQTNPPNQIPELLLLLAAPRRRRRCRQHRYGTSFALPSFGSSPLS
jgi:hypothetical protein